MAIAGRVEAKYTNPSSADVTLTPANYSSGQTVSLAAGSYYHSAAGSVSGGLATWQTALNTACSGYARTAASAATMLGGLGDFTGGAAYLCDEASGNLAAAFGSPATLTASGTSTYGITGPASAGDKAISFASSAYFDGGDVYEVDGTTDFIMAWVGKWTGAYTAFTTIASKVSAAFADGWALSTNSGALDFRFQAKQTAGTLRASGTTNFMVGEWHVGIAFVSRTDNVLRMGICKLSDLTQSLGSAATPGSDDFTTAATLRLGKSAWGNAETAFDLAGIYIATGSGIATGLNANLPTALTNFANAINSSYTVSLSSTDGRVTIANSFWDYSLTWTSTTLRDLFGFDADIASVQTATGTSAARGVWCPNAAMDVGESDPRRAPRVTDLRTTTSPTGVVKGLTGTGYYRHRNLRWPLVPEARTWEAAADYANGSWETFFADTQLGEHSWFDVSSPIQIYDHNGLRVGSDKDVAGWQITGISEINPKRVGPWTGLWRIEIPEIVSSG